MLLSRVAEVDDMNQDSPLLIQVTKNPPSFKYHLVQKFDFYFVNFQ